MPKKPLPNRSPRISFVSLGCPKALVDSERIITRLRAEGYDLTRDHTGADVVIINTCGFIDSAREESFDHIAGALAENGRVIVTGCMGAAPGELTARFPSLLAVTGPQAFDSVMAAVHAASPPRHKPFFDLLPPQGIKLTPRHYAYVKISEGCDNACSFCIIPRLRGTLVSRPAAEVLDEAERLVSAGVRELLIISQDTGAYGRDVKYAPSLRRGREVRTRFLDLFRELGALKVWVRPHYVYPYPHIDDILPLMAEGSVLPYLDVPLQHAAPMVLKRMKRPAHQDKTLKRIGNWRALCPDLTIRSTFIVGFPGETEAEFALLLDWLKTAELDRVGCFKFEAVTGAPASLLPDQVPEDVKEERFHRFMLTQQAISAARLKRKVGTVMPVIIDRPGRPASEGRGPGDAPDIDGMVFVSSPTPLKAGDIVSVRITGSDDYDLYGETL
ncbi:MAG: 30S ribosomal protein S12 methylthiotransferase RimO [Methylobacteriaceae bacterium]|jgi:ribosomal protein S12 methylthiotransferase|nr:30S ribosomal protein S12 methylthiotransferase RimO [Methylobacteriaceae bacterium]